MFLVRESFCENSSLRLNARIIYPYLIAVQKALKLRHAWGSLGFKQIVSPITDKCVYDRLRNIYDSIFCNETACRVPAAVRLYQILNFAPSSSLYLWLIFISSCLRWLGCTPQSFYADFYTALLRPKLTNLFIFNIPDSHGLACNAEYVEINQASMVIHKTAFFIACIVLRLKR